MEQERWRLALKMKRRRTERRLKKEKKKKKKATVAQDDKVEIKEVKKKKILQAVKPREDTWKELVVEKVKKKKKRVESEIGEVEKEVVVKKKRPKSSNNPETSERDEEESKMVKRQKKEKREAFASTKEKALVEEEVPKKKKKIHSNGGEKQALMEEEVPKKKKKFHSNEGEKQVGDGETKGMFAVDSCNKAKKLKKCASAVEIETQKESPMMSGKKVKIETVDKGNRKIKVENFDPEEQEAELQNDVVFLSETKGNKDEINIDQARRLALQNEIDVKSNPVQPKVELGLGQWGTAQFDSSDQQNKFLRLMGGFKKGGQPMGAKGATTAVRANMALTKDGQQSMQQKLLGEFERAQSRRMDFTGRAAGLGFSAPSNKKFSIDVNATRSVRFDD
ncbi:hypothetical protein UPYG_G00059620 [Umbra pygmaea]|uniref:Small acidic protein-like domain-containing protein n=1 Tax=Umbra pygmaea TaxID=75934 RepID=A0ABD0X906_UMBPY